MYSKLVKKFLVLLGAMGLLFASQVWASETASAQGQVRRIDTAKGTITIKHEAIADLKLPAMTLVYQIDLALLENIKQGDEVSFTAEHDQNQYRVIKIKK